MKYEQKIKELREEAGYTQTEIAEALNTSTQYYQKYEKGKHPLPIHHLRKLSEIYGVSADYILGLPRGMKYP